MNFIDEVKISVSAGDGGNGVVSFLRQRFKPWGGPDGGDGGKGGDVIIQTDKRKKTLIDYKYRRHFRAEHGKNGEGSNKTGRSGKDLIIPVPVGTVIKEIDGAILVDLAGESDRFILAHGGKGGRGNARFKSSINQAPKFAENGKSGDKKEIYLELKLLADAGIIGLPNAGKSTLISKISKSKPKIADYPFTTTSPNIGIVANNQFESFVAADIPGLIEGAHLGRGLGIKFLRHIERTKILVHLIDIFDRDFSEIKRDERIIKDELSKYTNELAKKKRIIVFSKIDLLGKDSLSDFKKRAARTKVFKDAYFISAASGEGINELKNAIFKNLRQP